MLKLPSNVLFWLDEEFYQYSGDRALSLFDRCWNNNQAELRGNVVALVFDRDARSVSIESELGAFDSVQANKEEFRALIRERYTPRGKAYRVVATDSVLRRRKAPARKYTGRKVQ